MYTILLVHKYLTCSITVYRSVEARLALVSLMQRSSDSVVVGVKNDY